MLKDITVGRYVYGNSILHRLNPSVKIVLTIMYAAAVFAVDLPWMYAVYCAFGAILVFLTGLSMKVILKGLKPLMWLLLFTTVFNVFCVPGNALFTLFGLTATVEGLEQSMLLAIRLILTVTGASLLTLTTSPLQLTDGMEKLLKPLNKLKISSHEIAMMMSIALRFIPVIAEQSQVLIKSQKARGADFESGGIFKRAKAMLPIIIPLLAQSLCRAEELAEAMDARCYNGKIRTRMKQTYVTKVDFIAIAIMLALFAAAVIF